MEKEQMLLESLVEELQQSIFDIPFEAWFYICKKLRADIHEVHNIQYKELTDIEARLSYARYMFHVTTNYRALCKSIITGFPDFTFPEEVKNMLLMAKINDVEKEHQGSEPQSSLSSPPKKKKRLFKFENDGKSPLGILNRSNSDCSQHKRMISHEINQQVEENDQSKNIEKSDESLSPKLNASQESSRLLFINPEPPSHKVVKLVGNKDSPEVHPSSDNRALIVTVEKSSSVEIRKVNVQETSITTTIVECPSVQSTLQNLDNSTSNTKSSSNSVSVLSQNESNNSEKIVASTVNTPDCTHLETATRSENHSNVHKNLKREHCTNQQIKRFQVEKFTWTTPRPIYQQQMITSQRDFTRPDMVSIAAADTSVHSTTGGKFILTACERDHRRMDPRIEKMAISENTELDELKVETLQKDVQVRESASPTPICIDLMDSATTPRSNEASEGELEPTANKMIADELSKCENSTIHHLEGEVDISSSVDEEEDESEGEEVAPECFSDCFERRRRPSCNSSTDHDGGDGASIISSISDSSSSFYSAPKATLNFLQDKSQSVASHQHASSCANQFQVQSGGSGTNTSSGTTSKMFRITIDNEYCNATCATVTPPLISPSSTASINSVETTILQPENIFNDIDDRIPINIVKENALVDSMASIPDSSSSSNSQGPIKLAIPPNAPFHWHAVNYPSQPIQQNSVSNCIPNTFAQQSDFQFPTLQQQQITVNQQTNNDNINPWVEAFEATKSHSHSASLSGPVATCVNVKRILRNSRNKSKCLLDTPKIPSLFDFNLNHNPHT